MEYENTQLSPEQEGYIERQKAAEARAEIADELSELADQIYGIMDEMRTLLREKAPGELRAAESYWMAHIDGALENREGNLGGSFISLQDTIRDLKDDDDQEEWE